MLILILTILPPQSKETKMSSMLPVMVILSYVLFDIIWQLLVAG